MLQQYNFLYNQQSLDFRQKFIERWNVREILDFISVRGLFQKGGADTKGRSCCCRGYRTTSEMQILHATFRRGGRVAAQQGFDIDYYDLHWLPRELALTDDRVWRTTFFGGGRVLFFVDRLKKFRTVGEYADERGWETGRRVLLRITGAKQSCDSFSGESLALTRNYSGPMASRPIRSAGCPSDAIERPRSPNLYRPPLLLVRLQMDLHHDLWTKHFLAFQCEVFGMAASAAEIGELRSVKHWIEQTKPAQGSDCGNQPSSFHSQSHLMHFRRRSRTCPTPPAGLSTLSPMNESL